MSVALTMESIIRTVSITLIARCSYARTTSRPVMASSHPQTKKNVRLLASTCSAASCMSSVNLRSILARGALCHLVRHQVDERENEHPDQVDKVPVESAHFDVV